MIELYDVRHLCPEVAGIEIERPNGYPSHTFLHFVNPVEILVDNQIVRTQPHACILYKAGTPQKYYSPSSLANDYIHFGPGLEDALKEYEIAFNTIYYPSDPHIISSIILEMQQTFFSEAMLRSQLLEVKLREVFIKMARNTHHSALSRIDHNIQRDFLGLRVFILTQLDKPWTVEQMADRLNISKSRFHSLYKDIFGCSPASDLINARIDRAKSMLTLSNESISSIAAKLGYNSPAHFMRQFKAIVGVAPGSYRKGAYNSQRKNNSSDDATPAFSITIDSFSYHNSARKEHPEFRRIIPSTK